MVIAGGIGPSVGMVINAPYREEIHEKHDCLIQQDGGTMYSLGFYACIRKITAASRMCKLKVTSRGL